MKKSNKTIAVTLRFWTNDLKSESTRCKKSCWDAGVAIIEANKEKGIKATNPIPFNCLEDVIPVIKEHMRKQKILMVSDCGKTRKALH